MTPQSPKKNNALYKNATMKIIDEALELLSPCTLARLQSDDEKMCCSEKGHLVAWNPFHENYTNKNTSIVGAAGSGKSSMIHALVHSMLNEGGRVFVLDTYFEKRTPLTDKQCVEVSPFVGLNLNPFAMMPLDNPHLIKDGLLLIKCVACTDDPAGIYRAVY